MTGAALLERARAVDLALGGPWPLCARKGNGELMTASDDGLETYLTLKKVAELSGYSIYRVRDFTRMDESDPQHLPTVRLGREFRVRKSEFEPWIQRLMALPIPERQRPGTSMDEATAARRRRKDEEG